MEDQDNDEITTRSACFGRPRPRSKMTPGLTAARKRMVGNHHPDSRETRAYERETKARDWGRRMAANKAVVDAAIARMMARPIQPGVTGPVVIERRNGSGRTVTSYAHESDMGRMVGVPGRGHQ